MHSWNSGVCICYFYQKMCWTTLYWFYSISCLSASFFFFLIFFFNFVCLFVMTAQPFILKFIFSPSCCIIILLNQLLFYLFSSSIVFNETKQFSPTTIYPSNNHSFKIFVRLVNLSVRGSVWPFTAEQSQSFHAEKDFQSCSSSTFKTPV